MSYPMAESLTALAIFAALSIAWCGFRAWEWIEKTRRRRANPIPLRLIG